MDGWLKKGGGSVEGYRSWLNRHEEEVLVVMTVKVMRSWGYGMYEGDGGFAQKIYGKGGGLFYEEMKRV